MCAHVKTWQICRQYLKSGSKCHNVCAREICGERCVTIVFLVGAHIVDSWAHDYASTRLHSLQKQQWQNPRLAEGWSCTDSTCTRAFHFTGFYGNCFSYLFLIYFIMVAMIYSLSKSEYPTTGYRKNYVNTCIIISY